MSSLNGKDYDYLFALGQKLYYTDSITERRAIATTIMAMVESVRGQQIGWPSIAPRYRHLTTYPPKPETDSVIRIYPRS